MTMTPRPPAPSDGRDRPRQAPDERPYQLSASQLRNVALGAADARERRETEDARAYLLGRLEHPVSAARALKEHPALRRENKALKHDVAELRKELDKAREEHSENPTTDLRLAALESTGQHSVNDVVNTVARLRDVEEENAVLRRGIEAQEFCEQVLHKALGLDAAAIRAAESMIDRAMESNAPENARVVARLKEGATTLGQMRDVLKKDHEKRT